MRSGAQPGLSTEFAPDACNRRALVAIDAKLRAAAISWCAIVAGLLHGYVNGATMAPGGSGERIVEWLMRP
jgi:hypothetical protein